VFETNVDRVMAAIEPHHLVLDIGGWARPFNRANWVLDAEPYETRGYYGADRPAQGGAVEHFTRDTWVVRDICDHTPYPWADKQFDFVICSHVLEDIRDPLWVCAEMRRIGKRGYIEMPSREAETSRGIEPNQVGWSHHRWLASIDRNRIVFLMKYHRIHSHWRLSLPAAYLRSLDEARQVQWLFWDDWFDVEERTIHGVENIDAELAAYVESVRPYSSLALGADRSIRMVGERIGRAGRWVNRRLAGTAGRSPATR
jgi:Methyltransferase domain